MCKLNKPRIPGLFAGSTTDYGSIVDRYQPVLASNNSIERDEFFANHITMTREEFDEHNFCRQLGKSMKDYWPNETVRKFSNRYIKLSNYLHQLILANIK